MVRWIGLVLMTPKTRDNYRQREKQIIRLKRNHICFRTKKQNDNNVKHLSLLILKISFLTIIGWLDG